MPAEEAETPFALIAPLHRTTPLVFASPHSGRRYPQAMLDATHVPLISLRRSEDAFVDELIAGAAAYGAPVLCATYARAYVDLNRGAHELDQEMFSGAIAPIEHSPRVMAGLGVLPRVSGDGREIYRAKLPAGEARARIAQVHAPYHVVLDALLEESHRQFGCAVLIDCHSMPSGARGATAPDIVLGDRHGLSCHPAITALAEATLRALGYRVSRNTPFAGGYSTQRHGRPWQGRHALQIEMARDLYVHERSLTRTHGFERLRADLGRLAEALAAAEFHRSLG
jgi:N-formylglutamate amidohydrolase